MENIVLNFCGKKILIKTRVSHGKIKLRYYIIMHIIIGLWVYSVNIIFTTDEYWNTLYNKDKLILIIKIYSYQTPFKYNGLF